MDSVDISENFRLHSQGSFNLISTNFNGLFILSFNIRSLNKNGWKFAPYIDRLNKKPDIIVLSETWFNETNIDNLPGYKLSILCLRYFVEMDYVSRLQKYQNQTLKYLTTSILNYIALIRKQLILLIFIEHLPMVLEHVSYLRLKKYPTHFPVEK